MRQHAFSLVELSIVLVILGLLAGGILAGQSLIRASEMRAVAIEYNRYVTATHAFHDKYFGLPGDITNAVSIWGLSTSCGGSSATGTCNGDGSGDFTVSSTEQYHYWRQLALAGLIEGNYTGTAGAGGSNDNVIGTNCPPSKLPSAGWSVETRGSYAGGATRYAVNYGNDLTFGSQQVGSVASNPTVLKPEEAWNIDTKLDDGMPGTGKVIVRSFNSWGSGSCSTSASETDYTGVYRLTNTSPACSIYFARAF